MADEKTPVRFNIFHQSYSLLVPGDPADMLHAATVVDDLITAIAKSRNLDSTRAAVFACLHLADRVNQLERKLHSVEQQTQRISSLLDRVID